MSRSRRFCPYCGQMIDGRSTTCRKHMGLVQRDPHLDGVPPDPLESLPLMAADVKQGEDSQAPKGTVI